MQWGDWLGTGLGMGLASSSTWPTVKADPPRTTALMWQCSVLRAGTNTGSRPGTWSDGRDMLFDGEIPLLKAGQVDSGKVIH